MARAPAESPAWSDADLKGDPHRIADKADRVRRMFDAIAPRYDLNNRLHSLGQDQRWRRAAVRLALRPGDRVLDVACGTGDLAECFADRGAGEVVGVDFTPSMLELAQRKAAQRGRRQGVTPAYLAADAMALPFGDAEFDVVSIGFGLRNVAEPARALAEFRRVLRPGGRLVILEFTRPRQGGLRWLHRIYCDRIMPWTASLIARDRSGAYRYLPRSVQAFPDHHALAEAVRTAGFEILEQKVLSFGICAVTVASPRGAGAERRTEASGGAPGFRTDHSPGRPQNATGSNSRPGRR